MPNFQTLEWSLPAEVTTTPWYRLQWTTPTAARMIQGVLTTGDTITVQFSLDKLVPEQSTLITSQATSVFSATSAYATTRFQDTYEGAPRWVRIVKTGTNGVARVIVEG